MCYGRKGRGMNIINELYTEYTLLRDRIKTDLKEIVSPLLLCIFLAGILFRIIAFGEHTCLHIDEALYAKWAASIGYNFKVLFRISEVDKPPLFYYILGIFIALFGPNDNAVKLPGLLVGIALIIMVSLIAFQLGKKKAAVWAAFFCALSPLEILYAPTVFAETTCIFFCLLCVLCLLYRMPVLSGLSFGLALAVKQTVFFFFPLYVLIYLSEFYPAIFSSLKKLVTGFLIAFIPLMIWAVFFSSKGYRIFFAIYQSRFFSASGKGFQLVKWLDCEKFITGTWINFIVSLLIIVAGLIISGVSLYRSSEKPSVLSYLKIISLFLFVVGYTLLISWLHYPLYSRYILVISSVYTILCGICFAELLNYISSHIKKYLKKSDHRGLLLSAPLISFFVVYWFFTASASLRQFQDGAHYRVHETIKPCIEYIKAQSPSLALFYTDEMWPWIPWYFFAERKKGKIIQEPADFSTASGIKNLLDEIQRDKTKLTDRKIYFIINQDRDYNALEFLKQATDKKIKCKRELLAQPSYPDFPAYIVYSISLESLLTSPDTVHLRR